MSISKEQFEREEKELREMKGKILDPYEAEVRKHFPDVPADIIRQVGGYKNFLWLPARVKDEIVNNGYYNFD